MLCVEVVVQRGNGRFGSAELRSTETSQMERVEVGRMTQVEQERDVSFPPFLEVRVQRCLDHMTLITTIITRYSTSILKRALRTSQIALRRTLDVLAM